jgi:hypothetical protein
MSHRNAYPDYQLSLPKASHLRSAALLILTTLILTGCREIRIVEQTFEGITYTKIIQTEPVNLVYHVVEIDLTNPNIHFTTTESNGALPHDTRVEATRTFVARRRAQLGINANFFVFNGLPNANVISLAASDGDVYSPWQSEFIYGLNISSTNEATIIRRPPDGENTIETDPPVDLYNTVSGKFLLIEDGEVVMPPTEELLPLTIVATTYDNHLLLMIVDGRQPKLSVGMTYRQAAEALLEFGPKNAISLDGGGSSTLVIADPTAKIVSTPMPPHLPQNWLIPSPGIERRTGSNLAVYAQEKGSGL